MMSKLIQYYSVGSGRSPFTRNCHGPLQFSEHGLIGTTPGSITWPQDQTTKVGKPMLLWDEQNSIQNLRNCQILVLSAILSFATMWRCSEQRTRSSHWQDFVSQESQFKARAQYQFHKQHRRAFGVCFKIADNVGILSVSTFHHGRFNLQFSYKRPIIYHS